MQIGLIGLGKMGSRIAGKLISEGHQVVVWNRTPEDSENLKKDFPQIEIAGEIKILIEKLEKPRVVWVMVPHDAVEEVLAEVEKDVAPGDVVIDGGNSHYEETDKRYEDFKNHGIHYLGIGTSGGILASENGYPFMVGGSEHGYKLITPILDSLSRPNGGHEYFGIGGAGHYLKMVHNGIEYGIMQSFGEGFDVLKNSKYNFDLLKISELFQKGTLVSGFILDRTRDALEAGDVEELKGEIGASGEAQWTVDAAKEEGIDVEIIEHSLEYRNRSKTDEKIQNSFTAKMVAALRREFGGHEVKKS